MQPEKPSRQRWSAEVPSCSPGCWHCCCGFTVTFTCVCLLPQRRNGHQQNFWEIIDLNPYSKKEHYFHCTYKTAQAEIHEENQRRTQASWPGRHRTSRTVSATGGTWTRSEITPFSQVKASLFVQERACFSASWAVNIRRLFHTAQGHMLENVA